MMVNLGRITESLVNTESLVTRIWAYSDVLGASVEKMYERLRLASYQAGSV